MRIHYTVEDIEKASEVPQETGVFPTKEETQQLRGALSKFFGRTLILGVSLGASPIDIFQLGVEAGLVIAYLQAQNANANAEISELNKIYKGEN